MGTPSLSGTELISVCHHAELTCFGFFRFDLGGWWCAYMCECMYMYTYVCVYMCSCTWKLGSEDDVCVLLLLLWDSLWLNLELTILWLGWLPSVLLQSSCLCLSQYQKHMWLYPVFMWVLEILTEAGAANSLVPEAFLQPVPQSLKSLRWRQKQ